jgi:PAS domain S-box-containing protein
MKKAASKPVSDERRARRGRRTDDQRPNFADLVESAVEGVLVHRNFRPLYANQAFAQLFGYNNPNDILALPLLKPLIPNDSWARMEEDYNDLIRRHRPAFVTRMRGLHKKGHEIWLAVTERAIDWHGKPAVHLTAFDISSQMAAEQTLLQNEQHSRAAMTDNYCM